MTWLPGMRITAARLNLPAFNGYQTTPQTLTTAVWTAISIDTETFDTDSGHDNVTNNTRYTIQVDGLYVILGTVAFAASATGLRGSKIFKNGAVLIGSETLIAPGPATGTSAVCQIAAQLVAGDYIELYGFQQSGGNLNTLNNGECASTLLVTCIRT